VLIRSGPGIWFLVLGIFLIFICTEFTEIFSSVVKWRILVCKHNIASVPARFPIKDVSDRGFLLAFLIALRHNTGAVFVDNQVVMPHLGTQADLVKALHIGKQPVIHVNRRRADGDDAAFGQLYVLQVKIPKKRFSSGDVIFVLEHAGRSGCK